MDYHTNVEIDSLWGSNKQKIGKLWNGQIYLTFVASGSVYNSYERSLGESTVIVKTSAHHTLITQKSVNEI